MQRCNGFLISGIALTAGAPLCISWFGLVGFYFGALSLVAAAVISWIVYFWLIYLVLTRPHNQRFVERFVEKIYIDCRYLLFSMEHCVDMGILCQFSQSA